MILQGRLEETIVRDMLEHEGCVTWPYCDSKGFVTIGIGHLLATDAAMLSLHMFRTTDGREATDNEKRTTWHLCKGAYAPNRGAIAYRAITDLRITKDTAMQLCKTRLAREFMPAVEKACPEITAFPAGAIRAIVDIAYNVGIGFARGFPSLIAACNARDWATAAKECTRKDARRRPTDNDMEGLGPRNIWTIARFKEAATQEEDGEEFNRSLNEHS